MAQFYLIRRWLLDRPPARTMTLTGHCSCPRVLLLAEISAVAREPRLQPADVDRARHHVAGQRERGGGAGRLAHDEAGTGDAGGGLAEMGHRGAAAGDQQIVPLERQ